MTERQYIQVSNKQAITDALRCLTGVLRGEEYGVNEEKYIKAYSALSEIQGHLFKVCKIGR